MKHLYVFDNDDNKRLSPRHHRHTKIRMNGAQDAMCLESQVCFFSYIFYYHILVISLIFVHRDNTKHCVYVYDNSNNERPSPHQDQDEWGSRCDASGVFFCNISFTILMISYG